MAKAKNIATSQNIKPITNADKLLQRCIEKYTITYSKPEDGLPKPKITKDDLESWN